MKKIKISELPESQSIEGLHTIGVNSQNESVKVPLGRYLGPVATAAQDAAAALEAAQRADEDTMQLKAKLQGVTASETKATLIIEDNEKVSVDGTIAASTGEKIAKINVLGKKSARFWGYRSGSTHSYGYCVYSSADTLDATTLVASVAYDSNGGPGNYYREYSINIPANGVMLVVMYKKNNFSSLESNFYCYLQSGETVVDMIPKVDNTVLQNPKEDSITKAVDSMKINSNLGKKNLTEVKLENYTAYLGRIVLNTSTSPKIGNRGNTNFNYIIVDVEGVTSVRFRGCTLLPADDDSGWAFYNETNYDPESQATNDGGFLVDSTGFINFMQYDRAVDTPKIKEYIVDVPEGAKYMKINSKYFTNGSVIFGSTFYCYLRYGKDIADILNKKVNSDNTLGVFKWKKNLLNPSEFVNGSIETPSEPGSTPVLTNPNSLLSNKLYLENNETYTLSNVSVYKSGGSYYLLVFEFDENDVYLGYRRYTAEKTSSGTTNYVEVGRRTLVYKKAYSACAYQRIRVRYAVLPTYSSWESWKTAQVEIGNQQTEYAPYHSEMYFPPLTTKTPSEGVDLGSCNYSTVHNLAIGENVEDNKGSSTKWKLIRYDASGSDAVYVSGEYGKGYYTLYPYVWADADGNKIGNVTTIYTTKTKNRWTNVRLYVPDGAKYLYLIAFGTKINTYKFELVTNYDALSLPDYIEDVINSNNEALKESMKKTVNILAIGNSYSQDSLMYVPFLMQSFDVNVNMTVLMKSSSTLTDAYNSFVNEDPIYIYQYYRAETDNRWHSLGTSNLFTIQKALEYNINYDIILINASWGWGQNTIETYNKLTSMITDYLDYPVKFACLQVLIHRSATNTHTDPDVPALWDSTKQYAIQDFVLYEGKIYWALASNINKVPTNTTYWDLFYKDWSDTKTYSKNAIVYYNNVLYISNSDANIANEPSISHFWRTYEWDEYYTYSYLDHCIYNGRVYVSRVETINTGNQPDESPSQWMLYNRPMTVLQFEEHQNSQIDTCELVMDNTLCEDIIPVNAAIKNAYTVDAINSIGAYKDNISNTTGFGWLLADDGFHLQEGLPCQLSAYAVCVWLLKKLGMDYKSILGDNTMATAEWLADKYIQGQQGLPCGYDSTDEENNRRLKFIQKCAVMANKFPYEAKDMNVFY